MILQTLDDSVKVHESLNEGYFGLEALHLLLNIVLPILIFVLSLFIIYKFYKLLSDMNNTHKDIRDLLKKNK
jgi:Na+/melibiose symporter-like transporter